MNPIFSLIKILEKRRKGGMRQKIPPYADDDLCLKDVRRRDDISEEEKFGTMRSYWIKQSEVEIIEGALPSRKGWHL